MNYSPNSRHRSKLAGHRRVISHNGPAICYTNTTTIRADHGANVNYRPIPYCRPCIEDMLGDDTLDELRTIHKESRPKSSSRHYESTEASHASSTASQPQLSGNKPSTLKKNENDFLKPFLGGMGIGAIILCAHYLFHRNDNN